MSETIFEEDSPGPPSEPPPILYPPVPARPRHLSHENLPSVKVPVSSAPSMSSHNPDDHDLEDEISQQMTASYSEISFNSDGHSPASGSDNAISLGLDQIEANINLPEHIKQRPVSLQCDKNSSSTKKIGSLDLDGTIHVEGNMTYFVAEDLEYKIKLSSPITKKSGKLRRNMSETKFYKDFLVIDSDEDETGSLGGSSRTSTPSNLYRQTLAPQFVQVDANILTDLECEAQRIATSIDNLTENLGGILHSISSITADNVDTYKDAVSKMSDAMDSNIKGMYTIIAKAEEVSLAMSNVQYHAERLKEIRRLVDLFE